MLHVFVAAADDDIRPGSTGTAVPGYQAEVLGPDGRPAADGERRQAGHDRPHRLPVPGRPAAGGCTCRTGWNVTGDTYIRDADGYLWYQGRSDDIIVSAGYNIAPAEIERALELHPDVVECAVVGKPDADRGMIVHAAVVLSARTPGDEAKIDELRTFMKQRIAPYKYPRSIEFVAALPRTATGKVQRFRIRTDDDVGVARPGRPVPTGRCRTARAGS